MKKIITIIVLFVGMISTQGQEINWLSFEKAIELNKNNPKPILVDLYTDWCGWCKTMDATTYRNKTIVKYINDNYYAVKLDGEGKDNINYKGRIFKFVQQGRDKYHELAVAILKGRMSYPSTAFFDNKERLLQVIPGYLKEKQFEKILAYFKEEAYKTMSSDEFDKNFKSAM